jgi:hypothetical protein
MRPKSHEQHQPVGVRGELVIPEKIVDKIMGPEPVPSIDIEMNEIQNELQRKLVEEVLCVMCN